jgi:kynureninase
VPTELTRAALEALDRADDLAPFREEFDLPADVIYLDGNSLGPLPKATTARVADVITYEWGTSLIRAWNAHDWIGLPLRIGEKLGRIIGAAPNSTLVADSTSVNLFKLLAAALAAQPGRYVIADPVAALNEDVAVLMLTHVDYRSGAMHDMAAVTRAAHAVGALTLWDLSHSVGAVPLHLAQDNVDLAVGCGYKYLNGGPGAPAFLSVAPHLQADLRLPLTGWLGHAEPFAFAPDYRPAHGIARATVGTPPVLSLAALEVGVDLMLRAPMGTLRAKSQRLIDLFIALVEHTCAEDGFRLLTPRDALRRGSQVAFAHPDGYAIMQTLIARGVIGDFRAPDVLRFGLAPMYVRYVDVWDAVTTLHEVMRTGAWRAPQFNVQQAVT